MTTPDSPAFKPGRQGYDPKTDSYHLHHEWDGPDSLAFSICRGIAVASGEDILSVPSLANSIDVDALAQLFARHEGGGHRTDRISFTHDGYTVAIYRTGYVSIQQLDAKP